MNDAAGERRWGSDLLAEVLRDLDVRFVAHVPGSSYRGLHDSIVNHLGNHDPELVLTLHEETAVAVAHGYAKVTELPMAAALHGNVGLFRAPMAIYNAWCDRAPVLVLGATGPYGGVVAILYARTKDCEKCCSDTGVSSHFVKSRTSALMSWAAWNVGTPGGRCAASRSLPPTTITGTRSHHAL